LVSRLSAAAQAKNAELDVTYFPRKNRATGMAQHQTESQPMGRSRVYCTPPANANWQHNTRTGRPIPRAVPKETARPYGYAHTLLFIGYPTMAVSRTVSP